MNGPRYSAIFYFLSRYKRLYGTILLLIVVTSLLESLSVAAFFPVFSSLLGDSQDEVGGILGVIQSAADLLPFSDPIVAGSVLLIALFVVKTVFTLIREGLTAYASAKVLYNVKSRIMDRYAGGQYQFFLDSKQGTLIYNGLVAPNTVGSMLLKGPQMVAFLLKVVAVAIVLGLIFPVGALAFVSLALVYYVVIHYLSRRISFYLGKVRASAGTSQTVITNEFITGIRHIIAFGATRSWVDRFDHENRAHSEAFGRHMGLLAVPRPTMELVAVGLMLGFVLIIRVFSPNEFVDVLPKLGVFAMALVQLLPALTAFGRIRMDIMGMLPDVELAYQTLTDPLPMRRDGTASLEHLEKGIAFENVTFAHKGREPLMKDVNLVFPKGNVTAVVGPSGAGKTTVINLILGLFEPGGGRITVDGVPLSELKQESWLSKIGFVSQDPFTYHSSVADNIIFGRNGHSMESVMEAARAANAHGFISELPEGYDTLIGDRGMKLSGGQQQRLAIARAVLDSPEILIFDEATSSLDAMSEKMVQEAIYNASRDRTAIIIAHRLSTIRYADNIVVLQEGQVVEQGTHQELLERQGHYSHLVASSG